MTTPLFSTYRQGENRVTSTFLAVLERLSRPKLDRIIGTLLGDENFKHVTFINQPQGVESTPDAKIEFRPSVWIETKIFRDTVKVDQIRRHLKAVSDNEKLLVLTPDDEKPLNLGRGRLAKKDRDKVVWTNFSTLDKILQEILRDKREPPTEKEAFLLSEFTSFIHLEGLAITSKERVMVVPSGKAWPAYKDKAIYGDIRDPNWNPSERLAFYVNKEIKPIVPKINSACTLESHEGVEKLTGNRKRIAKKLVEYHDLPEKFDPLLFIFLSQPCDHETLHLTAIKRTENGAYIQAGKKYVTLESLKTAHYTSELKTC